MCCDNHPSPWASSCSWSKLWRQMGWKRKAIPQLSASGTFPSSSLGSCAVLGLLPFPCDLFGVLVVCTWAGQLCIHASMCGCWRPSYCRQDWQGWYSKTSSVLPKGLLWGRFLTLSFPFPSLPFRCCIQVSVDFPQPSPAWPC